jgi:serine/threonine-protein kinase SRPK3
MADLSTGDYQELHMKEMDLDNDFRDNNICLPLNHFWINGPNGSHLCFVYPVAGPRVSYMLHQSEDPDRRLRKVALQAVQAMAELHSLGICHGG